MPLTEVTVNFLELLKPDFRPKPSARAGVAFSHVDPPFPELNRFFYATVGAQWFWIDKRAWTPAQWAERLADGNRLETWILTVDAIPAGYVELERKEGGAVEIEYFGLIPRFIGGGLGAHLLTSAVDRAFAMGATKVMLNTCSLDHPKARANYEARGFKFVRSETRMKEIPASPPQPW
jgi:GNAT superfamily N-acetyltransferase